MAADAHANFAYSALANAPGTGGTTFDVTTGEGALFPATPFNATVWPAGVRPLASNAEIVRVTGIASDALTVTRAQESTTAKDVQIGYQLAATITKKTLTDAETATNITADSTTLVGTATTVQGVLDELDNGIADHLADAADAHDASAISVLDTGAHFTATDVEAALAELATGTDVDSLTNLAMPVAATDVLLVVRSGTPYQVNTQQLRSNPVAALLGTDSLRYRVASDMEGFSTTFTSTTYAWLGDQLHASVVGTAAQITQTGAGSFVNGEATLATGTGTTGSSCVGAAGIIFFDQSKTYYFSCNVRVPTASDGTNTHTVYAGLSNQTTTHPTIGIFFQANANSSANWRCITTTVGSPTNTDSTVAIGTGTHTLAIAYNGTNAVFYVDNVQVASQSSDLPANSTALRPVLVIVKTAGGTSRTVACDVLAWDIYSARTGLVGMNPQ